MILLALLFVFPLALADDGCRNINAHGFFHEWQEPCEVDSDYDFCIVQKIRGTINGSWVSYYQNDWLVLLEDVAEVPTPPDAVESWYNRSVEVFTSKQGMVWGEAQFVYDLRAEEMNGGVSMPIIITGGTNMYEDAYGWITGIVTDFFTHGTIAFDGRVCGPNIPND
jgi:hypothetical protein